MSPFRTTYQPDTLPNDLLFAAGADELPGAVVTLRAGTRVPVDGKVVWFPLDAVVRCEGREGLFGGWIDRSGAVGLLEALDQLNTETRYVVEKDGSALSAPATFVNALIDRSPRFSRAVMQWLAQSCAAARQMAMFNLSAPAPERIVRLIDGLLHHHAGNVSMTQGKIAELTGVQRTTACGILKEMKAKGRLRYMRGKIAEATNPRPHREPRSAPNIGPQDRPPLDN